VIPFAVRRHSTDKPLSDALDVPIDEGKPIYSGDRSLMASRWAIKEAFYPPATQSIDDHITEWLSYEERQQEDGTPGKLIVELAIFYQVS
jgi:phosphopantetheinyl transferase (holo-ACP synthase)